MNNMYGISPKLPLNINKTEGVQSTKTIEENTKQNLKNLILTAPGERVMDPNFGVGLRNYLFENGSAKTLARLEGEIREQIDIYMPFINIINIDVAMTDALNENLMQVKIVYEIDEISAQEVLELAIDPKLDKGNNRSFN
tara:strand:+ start:558 stop:977 length:420 start_codon:yes stop_codon:yes gene_type:complete